jgi:diadenosine tetraphosphate (Ap4A) HIT family hydrolase
VSVFLEVPEAAWVCANDLAFAFRDRFPVSPGQTLVVTCVGERPRLREQRPDRAGYVMVEDRHAIV